VRCPDSVIATGLHAINYKFNGHAVQELAKLRRIPAITHDDHSPCENAALLFCSAQHLSIRTWQKQAVSARLMRLADLVIGSAILALLLPLMIIVFALMKLERPGPVLEKCPCIERGGRRFQILKFRTLMHDPEYAVPIRARKTQLGEFLRYTRIEDLPQLMNVIRGEMSLIDRNGRSPSFLS
jgi:lipopolysaccharide/colanic/teichoic acid biosynthesis glycosyltransferase